MHNRMAQPKVSDSEMQYYQFKARQMFLLQKEDYEWQQFCSRKISKCSTCKSECSSSSKDVGSQTVMRTSFIVGKKPPSESKLPPAQLHVDLNFIKSKLDRIDEMLSELKFSENDEQLEKTRLIASSSNLINSKVSAMESLDAGRRQFIQNSLKESLIRLHASAMGVPKTSTSKILPKNSGYFLPHNLQVQRAAARRSYLLSLNKPRLNKLVEKNKKSSTTIHTKLPSFSTTSGNIQPKGYQKKKVQKKQGAVKFRKKLDVSTQVDLLENPANGEANLNEQASEYKDENIECAVDGILTDLLGETVLSLNAIKQRKSKQTLSKTVGEKENTLQKYGSGADEIPAQHFRSDFNETVFKNEDKRDIGEKGEHLLPDLKNELRNPIGNDDQVSQKLSEEKKQGLLSHKYSSEAQKQTVPKTLRISIDSSRRIAKYRKEFWNYLKATSWVANENFNPWVLADMIAEAILEDCITDVCQDLGDLPSVFIDELCKQEFAQHM